MPLQDTEGQERAKRMDERFAEGVHFKLEGEHRKGCWCAGDAEAFIALGGIDWCRKKNGHRGGSTMWLRFNCNDPHCEAVALVRWDALARFITSGIEDSP